MFGYYILVDSNFKMISIIYETLIGGDKNVIFLLLF